MKLRTVNGLLFYADKKKNHMAPALVTVRVSADKIGKSLSLAVEDMGLLIGYKIEHLAYIARVMEKEGVTAEYAVRTFDDMRRVVRMLIEEAQQKAEEMLYEQFNQQTGGNRCDTATSGRRIG